MTSYKDRLAKLGKAWETSQPSEGMNQLPPGKYQFEIKSARLEESKAKFNLGHLQVSLGVAVITGQMKGRKHIIRVDLEQEEDKVKGFPSGMSRFKGHLKTLEVDMPKSLGEVHLKATLTSLVGIVFNGACVHNTAGYANVYINDLVNAAPEADDDEAEVETEDEAEVDEAEAEDEPAEESFKKGDRVTFDGEDGELTGRVKTVTEENAEVVVGKDLYEVPLEDLSMAEAEEEAPPAKKPAPKPATKPTVADVKAKKPVTKEPTPKTDDDDDWDTEFDKA